MQVILNPQPADGFRAKKITRALIHFFFKTQFQQEADFSNFLKTFLRSTLTVFSARMVHFQYFTYFVA